MALALEPFGYNKDKVTGEQSTKLRNLPRILEKFQDSRQTVYLSEEGLADLRLFASQQPDLVINNSFVMPLLVAAQESQAQGQTQSRVSLEISSEDDQDHRRRARVPRIRTAESPPSSDGEHVGVYFGTHSPSHSPSPTPSLADNAEHGRLAGPVLDIGLQRSGDKAGIEADGSFDLNDTTIHAPDASGLNEPSPGSEDTQFQPSNADSGTPLNFKKPSPSSRFDLSRSSPSPFSSDPRRSRPMPPSRRRKGTSHDSRRNPGIFDESIYSQPNRLQPGEDPFSGTPRHAFRTSPAEDVGGEAILEKDEIDNRSYNPHLVSPPGPEDSPSSGLNPRNISSVILQNRHKGLYIENHDADFPQDREQNEAVTEMLRRLRPISQVYTRVFESGIGLDDYPTPSSSDDLDSMREDYPKLIQKSNELRARIKELEGKMADMERIHENELMELSDKLEELQQDLSARKKAEKELKALETKYLVQLNNADEELSRMGKELQQNQVNYQKIKQKYEDCVGESDYLSEYRDYLVDVFSISLQANLINKGLNFALKTKN